ncbi:hypothetical protein KSP40_PGU006003 [Platanthera guangdongensis]|uniref:Uncharacterized protein n=1 Tax=Platanthera guangdongensis TaxID=2320717 RepID=A0ABR2M8S1_9ASPA
MIGRCDRFVWIVAMFLGAGATGCCLTSWIRVIYHRSSCYRLHHLSFKNTAAFLRLSLIRTY